MTEKFERWRKSDTRKWNPDEGRTWADMYDALKDAYYVKPVMDAIVGMGEEQGIIGYKLFPPTQWSKEDFAELDGTSYHRNLLGYEQPIINMFYGDVNDWEDYDPDGYHDMNRIVEPFGVDDISRIERDPQFREDLGILTEEEFNERVEEIKSQGKDIIYSDNFHPPSDKVVRIGVVLEETETIDSMARCG